MARPLPQHGQTVSVSLRVAARFQVACGGGCSCGGNCGYTSCTCGGASFATLVGDVERTPVLAYRVADAFHREALDFGTPDALRKYLREHPNADRSKHHVVKPEGRPSGESKDKEPSDHGKDKDKDKSEGTSDHDKKEPQKPLKERVKGWSEKALSFMKKAPESAQKFVSDDAFRRETLQAAHKALTSAPEKIVKRAINTAKEELHEFKTAAEGVGALMTGGKVTSEHKHAMKTVGFHIALTAAAAALTASGPLTGAAVFGKSMARHVALKAVTKALGHLHVLDEIGHVGHGVVDILSKLAAEGKKKADPEEVMGHFFTAAVAKELENFKFEDIQEALEADEEK